MRLENNAAVTGTVYAGGDIACQSTRAEILGDAYVSAANGRIQGCAVAYDAHADRILDSNIGGDAYYRAHPSELTGSTVAGNLYPGSPRPAAAAMPALDIDFWRNSAAYGGVVYGDHAAADGERIGPKKIEGDLVLGNGVDIVLTGPVWVAGDVITSNNASILVDASFGPYGTTLLADDPADPAGSGKVLIENGVVLAGSGEPTSHLLVISTNTSTSDTSPAISIANTTEGTLFYAPSGSARLRGNASARAVTATRLFIDQNAVVSYDASAIAGAQFSNSPEGVWRMVPGSWREVHE
jgi:hypothetical protein